MIASRGNFSTMWGRNVKIFAKCLLAKLGSWLYQSSFVTILTNFPSCDLLQVILFSFCFSDLVKILSLWSYRSFLLVIMSSLWQCCSLAFSSCEVFLWPFQMFIYWSCQVSTILNRFLLLRSCQFILLRFFWSMKNILVLFFVWSGYVLFLISHQFSYSCLIVFSKSCKAYFYYGLIKFSWSFQVPFFEILSSVSCSDP